MAQDDMPIILLAHGAWHPPKLYEPLKQALARRGYSLIIPPLPTMGVEATGVGWDADTARLLEYAEPLFAQGREVVLVGHSYGGIPACVATRGNSIAERAAAGKSGGFRHIVFVCAFALPASGLSNLTAIPGEQWMPWHHIIEREGGLFVNEGAKELLYNDLPADTAQRYFESLIPQSYAAVVQPVDFAVPDITIDKTYVVCERDNAFPTALQHHFGSLFGFKKATVSGGHTAFASVPDELAQVLVKIAEGDVRP